MELPCRRCTDLNDGVEVSKPLEAFTTLLQMQELWKSVRKGQDLCCYKCQHTLGWGVSDAVIPCDKCGNIKARKQFTPEMQGLWVSLSAEKLECKSCMGIKHDTLKDAELVYCNGSCQKRLPEYHFVEKMLVDWRAQDVMLSARCARCVVKDRNEEESTQLLCQTCGKTKHVTCFAPVALKQWMAGIRRAEVWSCYDCQFPPCCLCEDDNRQLHAINHNALINGKWYCADHRYPPCERCGKKRSDREVNTKVRFKAWLCTECTAQTKTCSACKQRKDI